MNGAAFVEWLNKYWPILGFLLNAAFAWLLWSMRKMFATKEEMKAEMKVVDTKIDAIAAAQTVTSGELALLKNTLAGMPTVDDVNEIKLSIANIEGDYKAVAANVDNMDKHITSIGRSVDRIEDWLMNGKGKGA